MKYRIKIKSKKLNPKRDNQHYNIAGNIQPIIVTIEPCFVIKELENYCTTLCDDKVVYEVYHFAKISSILDKYSKELQNHKIEIKRSNVGQTIFSLTLPPQYLYEYEETEVECCYCNAKFSFRDLEYSTYAYNDEVDDVSETTCPKCKSPNCCELEYEK